VKRVQPDNVEDVADQHSVNTPLFVFLQAKLPRLVSPKLLIEMSEPLCLRSFLEKDLMVSALWSRLAELIHRPARPVLYRLENSLR
jgi:hypothetical protein